MGLQDVDLKAEDGVREGMPAVDEATEQEPNEYVVRKSRTAR